MFSRWRRWLCGAAAVGLVTVLVLWAGPAGLRRASVRPAWHDWGNVIEWSVRRAGAGDHGLVHAYEVTTWRTWGESTLLDDVRAMHARSVVPPPQGDAGFDDRRPQHLSWDGVRWPTRVVAVRVQGSTWTVPYSLVVLASGGTLGVGLARAAVSGRKRRGPGDGESPGPRV